jgi:hypothetical protein
MTDVEGWKRSMAPGFRRARATARVAAPHESAKTFIHRCRSPEAYNLAIEPVDLRGAHVPSVEFTLVPSVAGVPRRFNAAAI